MGAQRSRSVSRVEWIKFMALYVSLCEYEVRLSCKCYGDLMFAASHNRKFEVGR